MKFIQYTQLRNVTAFLPLGDETAFITLLGDHHKQHRKVEMGHYQGHEKTTQVLYCPVHVHEWQWKH